MKKILLTTIIITLCFLTACHKNESFDEKVELTEPIAKVDNKENEIEQPLSEETTISDSKTEQEQTEAPSSKTDDNRLPTQSKPTELPPKEPLPEEPLPETPEPDAVDESSLDYFIHKGRIDCQEESSCMNISVPIQLKYKQSITNVFYLEVISKQDNILGYFIEYHFQANQYSSPEECELIGKEIQTTLSDRVVGYECTMDNILTINTDYQKEA